MVDVSEKMMKAGQAITFYRNDDGSLTYTSLADIYTAMHSAREVDGETVERVAKIIHPQAWEDGCWLARECTDQQQAKRSALAKAHEIIAAMGEVDVR